MNQNLKLTIDLVPETCWYSNLCKQMPRSQWDKLRKEVYLKAGNTCEICGAEGKLNCHELWNFDEDHLIQKLIGFIALCDLCHYVKHLGLAKKLASKGHLDLNSVIEHFKKVNNVSQKEFEIHKNESFRVWRERSQHKWQTDFGRFKNLINLKTT